MADPYATDPYGQTAIRIGGTDDYGDASAYEPILGKYRTAFAEREKQREGIEAKQQLNADQMSALLNGAAAKIRQNREGRSNLPMIALGAGMMGPGDFGTQVGRGLQAMVPAIEKQRKEEDETELQATSLGVKAGEVQNMPLKEKLDYLKALQTGDMSTIRAIETAQIRAQAQQAKANQTAGQQADKLGLETQKVQAAVIQKASAEALNQLKELNKDNDYTQKEMQDLYKELMQRQLALQAGGAGIQLKEDVIRNALETPMPTAGAAANVFPKTEEMQKEGEKLGLPEMPRTYDQMGSKDRSKTRQAQAAAYTKESAKWEEQAGVDKTNDDLLREAESIIRAHPDLLGKIAGRGWNITPEADRLNQILTRIQTTTIPKGQGQITDFERKLFADAGAQMTSNPTAALQTIKTLRDANNRSSEQRDFMEKYYRTYRTLEGATTKWEQYMRSKAGSYVVDRNGKMESNPDRMPSDIYFKWQRAGSPEIRRGPNGEWLMRRDGKVEVLE